MDVVNDPNTGLGTAVLLFVILPFWTLYFVALLVTKRRARAAVGVFGLTVLASCASWVGTSICDSQETPEHGFISNWNHRPRLWLTVLLLGVVVLAVATVLRAWRQDNRSAAFRLLWVTCPIVGAYVAYTWTVIAEFGFAALFRP
jgi:uncharacterized membrane protein